MNTIFIVVTTYKVCSFPLGMLLSICCLPEIVLGAGNLKNE